MDCLGLMREAAKGTPRKILNNYSRLIGVELKVGELISANGFQLGSALAAIEVHFISRYIFIIEHTPR
jgi:hypothetical protein